jgi:hypothetical protein
MKTETLHTEIEIEAAPEQVWQVLMDFATFPQWNPFIVEITGKAEAGAKLRAKIRPEGSAGMTFTPTVLAAVPNREFRWGGRLLIPGLMDGEHRFLLQPLGPDRTHLIHEEAFGGILVAPFLRLMGAGTLAGFHAMNRALKARVEGKRVEGGEKG